MAGIGNDIWTEFAKSYAATAGKKLGEEAVSTVKVGLDVGIKLGKLALSAGDEWVKSYGMYLLATGIVNIANEVGGPRRKRKKLRVVTSYTPLGMSDLELTCKGAELVLNNCIVPLKPVLGFKNKHK